MYYDFTINWGDGRKQQITSATSGFPNITHVYQSPGTYRISISENFIGSFPGVRFNNSGDRRKLLEIAQWGSGTWKTMERAFWGCSNMKITATDSNTAKTSMVEIWDVAFTACTSMTSFPKIDMSGGWDFTSCWNNCTGLAGDGSWIADLDLSNGIDFIYTWVSIGLTSFPLISIPKANNITGAFGDNDFTEFPLIDFSSVTRFDIAWKNCVNLTSFPLINTSKGTNFSSTWDNCSSLTVFPFLDMRSAKTLYRTWNGCSGLTSMPPLNFSKVTGGDGAFWGTGSLVTHPDYIMPTGSFISLPNFFRSSGISDESYSNFLVRLEAANPLNDGSLTVTSAKYTPAAAAARTALINRGWSIGDEGAAP